MTASLESLPPFLLETQFMPRVWGSLRMGDGSEPVGEAWGGYEGNRIVGGPLDGLTLAEACARYGPEILGAPVVARFGSRFPILTKLLDTRKWLSVQLHPDDEQAVRLEGPGHVGKTEAWHLLEAAPDSEIILGLKPATDLDGFERAARSGATLDVVARQPAHSGDTWFIPAGTIHALGPGLFLYEVQQSSDITYRVYDWGRRESEGRALHLDQAITCVNPESGGRQISTQVVPNNPTRIVDCEYFALDRLELSASGRVRLDTRFESFDVLTMTRGVGEVHAGAGSVELAEFQTALVPAMTGSYEVLSAEGAAIMIASTPVS